MDRSFKHSTAASNPTFVGVRGAPVEQTCIHESMLMSLEIRLINRALRASSSSSENQEVKSSGISEGELVEVSAWPRDELIGVSSLAGVGALAAEGTAKVSADPGIEGIGDEGAAAEGVSSFSFSLFSSSSSCSAAISSSSTRSFLIFSSSSFPSPYKHKMESRIKEKRA